MTRRISRRPNWRDYTNMVASFRRLLELGARRHRAYHRGMERLSGLDASFLYIETPTQPMHVCSILELETPTVNDGYIFDHLQNELSLRIKAMPELRAKLADSALNVDH